jgi:Ca-activated chloride channel family protein
MRSRLTNCRGVTLVRVALYAVGVGTFLLVIVTLMAPSLLRSRQAAPGPLPWQIPVTSHNAMAAEESGPKQFNTEAYALIEDNPFVRASEQPLATFSSDVDTASYANVRRFIAMGQRPPRDAVRIEEMVNYFKYDYPQPVSGPIAVYSEVAAAPWQPARRLVRIGIKSREDDVSKRPASNLVFLVDVSGSMREPQKLPLLKRSLTLLIDKLNEQDHVAIVVYAGQSGLLLPSTRADQKTALLDAIAGLGAGGSTNGAGGIQQAYETATANFIKGGVNRVILATDGDFNVGITDEGSLVRLIQQKAQAGVFLTVLGFGMGNYKDSTLEKLADMGNGNYAYIDSLHEAQKVLIEEFGGTLMTVAKDVKIQVEFNPREVSAYRLIGYENRVLRSEDFNDDKKDAGDMGAGHSVTAFFEVIPVGADVELAGVDRLRYQTPRQSSGSAASGEMLNVKVRYKEPDGERSLRIEHPVSDRGSAFEAASADFRFAAAVASFGMILRDSPYKAQSTLDAVKATAQISSGVDTGGYRKEFIALVDAAASLPKGN